MASALIAHSGAVGDFVLALRVVEALRSAGFDRVVALGREPVLRLGPFGGIREILDLDRGGIHGLYADDEGVAGEAIRRVRDAFDARDLVVHFGTTDAARRAGERLAEATGGQAVGLDPRPDSRDPGMSRHVVALWLAELRARGAAVPAEPGRGVVLRVPDEIRRRVRERVGLAPSERFALFHPGAGSAAKRLPEATIARIARRLGERGPAIVALGPAEEEGAVASEFAGRVARRLELDEFAALAAEASLFVGHDSGPSHVAAAAGAPTVAIFGATSPAVWAPLGPNARAIGERGRFPSEEEIAAAIDAADPQRGSGVSSSG